MRTCPKMHSRRNLMLAVLIVVIPLNALAEELLIRCDAMNSSSAPFVLSIDTSRKTVHQGRDPNSDWWTDRYHYVKNDPPGDVLPLGAIPGYKPCAYNVTQFVEISDLTIVFGETQTNIITCGSYGGGVPHSDILPPDTLSPPNTDVTTTKWVIARDTGVMSKYWSFRDESFDKQGSDYQCQRVNGNAF